MARKKVVWEIEMLTTSYGVPFSTGRIEEIDRRFKDDIFSAVEEACHMLSNTVERSFQPTDAGGKSVTPPRGVTVRFTIERKEAKLYGK